MTAPHVTAARGLNRFLPLRLACYVAAFVGLAVLAWRITMPFVSHAPQLSHDLMTPKATALRSP